jgi:hypothetical protein
MLEAADAVHVNALLAMGLIFTPSGLPLLANR